jgi:glucan phosphoethanolaminetransferase (alkaline phosphatase superfamily)
LNASFDIEKKYDDQLIIELKSALERNDQKNFIILHTIGSHFKYNLRYPTSYRKFRPDDTSDFTSTNIRNIHKKETYINSYDNSILYSDFIISKIIEVIKEYGICSWVMYFSDHGENLFDDDRNLFSHGSLYNTEYERRVPLFFWYSDLYMQHNGSKIAALTENRDTKTSLAHIYETIFDLAGIQIPDRQFKHSLANADYEEPEHIEFLDGNNNLIFF